MPANSCLSLHTSMHLNRSLLSFQLPPICLLHSLLNPNDPDPTWSSPLSLLSPLIPPLWPYISPEGTLLLSSALYRRRYDSHSKVTTLRSRSSVAIRVPNFCPILSSLLWANLLTMRSSIYNPFFFLHFNLVRPLSLNGATHKSLSTRFQLSLTTKGLALRQRIWYMNSDRMRPAKGFALLTPPSGLRPQLGQKRHSLQSSSLSWMKTALA